MHASQEDLVRSFSGLDAQVSSLGATAVGIGDRLTVRALFRKHALDSCEILILRPLVQLRSSRVAG